MVVVSKDSKLFFLVLGSGSEERKKDGRERDVTSEEGGLMWGRIIVAFLSFFLYTPGRTSLSLGASRMSGGSQNREEIGMDRCERSRVGYGYI